MIERNNNIWVKLAGTCDRSGQAYPSRTWYSTSSRKGWVGGLPPASPPHAEPHAEPHAQINSTKEDLALEEPDSARRPRRRLEKTESE